MPKQPGWPARWDTLLRYRLIEVIALWEGRLTTNHLQDAFGIGRQQASRDINTYIKEHGTGNLEYDRSKKGYVATKNFKPTFTRGEPTEYLQMLTAKGDLGSMYALPESIPVLTEVIRPPSRDLRPEMLSVVLQAAREHKRLQIQYCSLRSQKTEHRVIQPHTVVFTGVRWHVRAYCEKKKVYSDFVLSRIGGEPKIVLPGDNGPEGDTAWNTEVDLVVGPDKRLTKAQQKIIERDYSMENGQFRIRTRAALINYVLQMMRIERESKNIPPEIQQITLKNRDKIKKWLFEPPAKAYR